MKQETIDRVLTRFLKEESHRAANVDGEHYKISLAHSRGPGHMFSYNTEYIIADTQRVFNPEAVEHASEEAFTILISNLLNNTERWCTCRRASGRGFYS